MNLISSCDTARAHAHTHTHTHLAPLLNLIFSFERKPKHQTLNPNPPQPEAVPLTDFASTVFDKILSLKGNIVSVFFFSKNVSLTQQIHDAIKMTLSAFLQR